MNFLDTGQLILKTSDEPSSGSILVSGDTCIRALGQTHVLNGQSASILAPVKKLLDQHDLRFIQFETVLTADDTPICKSGPNLKSDPATIDFFKAWGGHVCLLANNHTGDYGPQPLLDTIDNLHQAGFLTAGAGSSLEQARQPLATTVGRTQAPVVVINACEHEFGTATPSTPGSSPLDPLVVVQQILATRRQQPEAFILVVTHGGNEYNPFPSPRMTQMLRTFADCGASAVVNIHTHCPQGIEIHHGVPIVYSLGNFYFPWKENDTQTYSPDNFWFTGYSVSFDFDQHGCRSLTVIPTHCEPDASVVRPLQGEELAGFLRYLEEISTPLADQAFLQRAHESWAANSSYLQVLLKHDWTPEDFADAPQQKIMHLRNLNLCEAHHEIIRTFFSLYEQQRLQQAQDDDIKQLIAKLQKASFITH